MEVKEGYKQTEVGAIPEDWEVKSLGSVINYTNGQAHENVICNSGEYIVVNSKFISTDARVRKHSNACLSPAGKGDVLMVMSDVPNGRAIAKCFLVNSNNLYTVNQRICNLKPVDINGVLLYYTLNRNPYYLSFDDGVKQTNLRKDDVLSCPLPLPPTKAEQETIAEALSDADALIESLEQLIAKKRQIKQGAMQELLTGKRRLEQFKENWVEKFLAEVATVIMGQSPKSIYYNNNNHGLPLVQGNADIQNRETLIRNYSSVVNKKGLDGDIIMTVRAPVGEIAKTTFDCCLGRGVCAIRDASEYLYHYLIFIEPTWGASSTGSTFDSVNSATINKIIVKIPPTEDEESAIATILSDMDSELDTLNSKLSKARQIKQGMMHNLLTGKIRLI